MTLLRWRRPDDEMRAETGACLVTTRTYEVRVTGAIGPATREAVADLPVDVEVEDDPAATVLTGDLGQDMLHRLLQRLCALGLELIDIRPVRRRPRISGRHAS
jgi:hypothetical protein